MQRGLLESKCLGLLYVSPTFFLLPKIDFITHSYADSGIAWQSISNHFTLTHRAQPKEGSVIPWFLTDAALQ